MNADTGKRLSSYAVGGALAVAVFFGYSFLTLSAPIMFNSPDENANHVFAVGFAETGMMHRVESLNVYLDGAVHPRSVKVVDGLQVPGGFIGLPLIFGALGKVVGTMNILLLTPVFALLGVLAWGLLMRRSFGGAVGVFAAFLLAINPAWWYWSARSMMPNVLFLSLILIAVCLFIVRPFGSAVEKRGLNGLRLLRNADYALAGIFAALALAVRPPELYWLALAAVVAAVVIRRLPWRGIAVALAFMAMTLAPFLMLNQSLYGGVMSTGYGDVAATVSDDAHQGMGARLLGPLRPVLFPLGFAPRTALANFWTYGLKFFWWWTAIVAASGVYLAYLRRKTPCPAETSRRVGVLLAVSAAVSIWLVPFYGSYVISDNSDPSAVTIGSSYFRYWLPLFVLSTAPVAAAAARLLETRRRGIAMAALIAAALILSAVSGASVFGAPQEGLSSVRASLVDNLAKHEIIMELTEPDAIVIAERSDKIVFPERSVIYPLRSEHTYALLPQAIRLKPTYYFGITFPEQDMQYLREVKLPPLGVTIEPVVTIGEETLYRFGLVEVEDSRLKTQDASRQ